MKYGRADLYNLIYNLISYQIKFSVHYVYAVQNVITRLCLKVIYVKLKKWYF